MLNSIPVPFQAILLPLMGAALVLALGRVLPLWGRQVLAILSAVASLAVLWSLGEAAPGRAEILWEPLNLFRMSPVLVPDGLSLAVGMTLAGVTAAAFLGIRSDPGQGVAWHSLMLVTLAGCLGMTMASNLIALALSSALIDLSLVLFAMASHDGREPTDRMPLAVTVPGIASTLVLLLAAIQMDAEAGHGSLLSRNFSEEALVLLGVAAVLRSLVYPLHPRDQHRSGSVILLLLPVGAGLHLVTRIQSLVPVLSTQHWLMAIAAVALLAGGLLAWSRGASLTAGPGPRAAFGGFWVGGLVQQTGYALVFLLLLTGVSPWPLISLMLALGALSIWSEGREETGEADGSRFSAWLWERLAPWRTRAKSYAGTRLPQMNRWRDVRLGRFVSAFLFVVSVFSLIGMPFTTGARGRWLLYAALLDNGDWHLLVALASDTMLVAGLSVAVGIALKQARERRQRPLTLLASGVLVLALVLLGLAPGMLSDKLGLPSAEPAHVSVWGLGLVYVLPWLLGLWLARMSGTLSKYLDRIGAIVDLNWLYRGAGWAGQRLVDAFHWLGRVGEGEGWWGWALVVLTLGILLLAAR
jgi:formate hydrogenlyase subunit 3/multisubunit Na+/H+ antiporter MnhD subunit